jgi:hypothetical protein
MFSRDEILSQIIFDTQLLESLDVELAYVETYV